VSECGWVGLAPNPEPLGKQIGDTRKVHLWWLVALLASELPACVFFFFFITLKPRVE